MLSYCVQDALRYYCDWNNSYYLTYDACYRECGIYLGNTLLHVSQVDFTFLAILFSALFSLAIFWVVARSWE